jgi:hypothetical protein
LRVTAKRLSFVYFVKNLNNYENCSRKLKSLALDRFPKEFWQSFGKVALFQLFAPSTVAKSFWSDDNCTVLYCLALYLLPESFDKPLKPLPGYRKSSKIIWQSFHNPLETLLEF